MCVFIIRDKFCDFVVIEIKEFFLDKCDIVFRRDDKKRVNVKFYIENLSNFGFVYKIGVVIDVIKGYIFRSEYYDKLFNENSWKNVFLVYGIDNKFVV